MADNKNQNRSRNRRKRQHSDDRNNKEHPAKKSFSPKYQPPSDAALALSASLKNLSSKKRLRETLNLYNDASNDDVRDSHHGSIVVDCCARCGAVE
eukprot:2462978-Ditylum_brightwellii.AAC.1